MSNIDKKFAKIGLIKVKESKYVIRYERQNAEYGYTQVLEILHKATGRHIVLSYDKEIFDAEGLGNTCIGLTYYEMKLALKKMKKLGYRTTWKESLL